MTVKQVARMLKVSKSLVYDWIESGRLPHFRFGEDGSRGAICVGRKELDVFVAGMRGQDPPMNPAPGAMSTMDRPEPRRREAEGVP